MRTSGAGLSEARTRRTTWRSQHSTPGWRSARPPPSWPRTLRRSTSTSRMRRWRRRPGSPPNGRLRGNKTWLNNLTQNWYKDFKLFLHLSPFLLLAFVVYFATFVFLFSSFCLYDVLPLGDSQTFLIIMWLLLWLFYPFPIFISKDRFLMISEHHPSNTPITFSSLPLIHPTYSISSLGSVFWN